MEGVSVRIRLWVAVVNPVLQPPMDSVAEAANAVSVTTRDPRMSFVIR